MSDHPHRAFVPLLRNELAPAESDRVTAHIARCAACARALAETREVVERLVNSLPAPPAMHWGAYRAQLRERLHAPRDVRAGWRGFMRPFPLATSVLAAALLAVLASQTTFGPGTPASDVAAFDEVVIGEGLPLLDLLEDLDIIRHLDRLPVREG
jgi:anti-sigma factor RsiW